MTPQLPLFPAPTIGRSVAVFLRCAACGHRWHAATIRPTDPVKPEAITKQCWCPACIAPPPMQLVAGL